MKEYIRCFQIDGASCNCYVKASQIERFTIDTSRAEPFVSFCLIDDPKKLRYDSVDVDYFEALVLEANTPVNKLTKRIH